MPEKMFTIGNLHGGPAYAFVATRPFGSKDIYGPFSTKLEASNAMHKLAAEERNLDSIEVVALELAPTECKRIVRDSSNKEFGYTYAV